MYVFTILTDTFVRQRKCWWDGLEVDLAQPGEPTLPVKLWARRVWTLELSLVRVILAGVDRLTHIDRVIDRSDRRMLKRTLGNVHTHSFSLHDHDSLHVYHLYPIVLQPIMI